MAKTSCTIAFGVYDTFARGDATYAASSAKGFSDLTSFAREDTAPEQPTYATLEENFVALDGSLPEFPERTAGLAPVWWSGVMSGANGRFPTPPALTVDFTQPHSSIGLTLHFADDPPCEITVQWYDSYGALLAMGYYTPTHTLCRIERMVENYRRVRITFDATAEPYRYVKLRGIDYGLEEVFGGSSLISARILEELNPISSQVTVNTLNLSVHSDDSKLSPLNPQGMFAYLQQKQQLAVTETIDGKDRDMGVFYLDKWEGATDNSISISAVDILGLIDQTQFLGGMYQKVPAATLVAQIMDSAGAMCQLDASLGNVPLSGHLPICSHREALQQVAMALGGIIDSSRGSGVRILPQPVNANVYVSRSRKVMGGGLQLRPLVTGVAVTSHRFSSGTEERKVVDEALTAGEHTFTFREPLHSLAITGGSIRQWGANHAVVAVAAPGPVTLTGRAYIDSTQVVTVSRGKSAGGEQKVVEIAGATLIDDTRAEAVAQLVYDYYQRRYENTFRVLPGTEAVGDYAYVDSLRNEKLRGLIESMEIDLTGGYVSNVKVVGAHVVTFNGYYTNEIRTGEKFGVI